MCEDGKTIICRCEEVSKEEILDCIASGGKTLKEIKMMTRAGMGLCQGKTCSRLIARILAEELGVPLDSISPGGYRPPLRPIPLHRLAEAKEEEIVEDL